MKETKRLPNGVTKVTYYFKTGKRKVRYFDKQGNLIKD